VIQRRLTGDGMGILGKIATKAAESKRAARKQETPFGERRAKVVNSLGKLTGFDVHDSQRLPRTDFLQMWYGFRSIALCQESIAEELVLDRQIGAVRALVSGEESRSRSHAFPCTQRRDS